LIERAKQQMAIMLQPLKWKLAILKRCDPKLMAGKNISEVLLVETEQRPQPIASFTKHNLEYPTAIINTNNRTMSIYQSKLADQPFRSL